MRLSRTAWLVLGIVIFVAGAITLYMLYQGQADKRQQARDELEQVQDIEKPMVIGQRGALQAELAQKENELVQWENTINQLEEQLAQLEITLSQTQSRFPVSVESIEYDEELFSFALDNNVSLDLVTASEPNTETIEEITYEMVSFGMEIKGEVPDLLAFINTIISDEDFKTASIEPVNLTIPELLSDEQIKNLEDGLRAQLIDQALAEITTEEIVRFTLEAIDTVVRDEFIDQLTGGSDGQLDAMNITEMAITLKERIADSISLGQDYHGSLADELAEIIAQQIAESAVNTIVNPLAEEIAALIMPGEVVEVEGEEEAGEEVIIYDQAALIELLGEDMAAFLGDNIADATVGSLTSVLNGYFAEMIKNKMINSVADFVEDEIEDTLPGMIEAMETPSASLTVVIYLYHGEGD